MSLVSNSLANRDVDMKSHSTFIVSTVQVICAALTRIIDHKIENNTSQYTRTPSSFTVQLLYFGGSVDRDARKQARQNRQL
eukprot:3453182-Pleurochrysis_carterae.AAC.1